MGKRPVIKKKTPRSAVKKRYSGFKKRAQKIMYEKYALVKCVNCGEMKLNHHICPNCGHYGKRKAIDMGKNVVKKIKA